LTEEEKLGIHTLLKEEGVVKVGVCVLFKILNENFGYFLTSPVPVFIGPYRTQQNLTL